MVRVVVATLRSIGTNLHCTDGRLVSLPAHPYRVITNNVDADIADIGNPGIKINYMPFSTGNIAGVVSESKIDRLLAFAVIKSPIC